MNIIEAEMTGTSNTKVVNAAKDAPVKPDNAISSCLKMRPRTKTARHGKIRRAGNRARLTFLGGSLTFWNGK